MQPVHCWQLMMLWFGRQIGVSNQDPHNIISHGIKTPLTANSELTEPLSGWHSHMYEEPVVRYCFGGLLISLVNCSTWRARMSRTCWPLASTFLNSLTRSINQQTMHTALMGQPIGHPWKLYQRNYSRGKLLHTTFWPYIVPLRTQTMQIELALRYESFEHPLELVAMTVWPTSAAVPVHLK